MGSICASMKEEDWEKHHLEPLKRPHGEKICLSDVSQRSEEKEYPLTQPVKCANKKYQGQIEQEYIIEENPNEENFKESRVVSQWKDIDRCLCADKHYMVLTIKNNTVRFEIATLKWDHGCVEILFFCVSCQKLCTMTLQLFQGGKSQKWGQYQANISINEEIKAKGNKISFETVMKKVDAVWQGVTGKDYQWYLKNCKNYSNQLFKELETLA